MSVHSVPSAPEDLKDGGFPGPGGERCKLEEPEVKKMAGGRGECSGGAGGGRALFASEDWSSSGCL